MGTSRRIGLLPLALAMLSLNLLLPEAAWATCGGGPTTQSFPPESGTANNDVIEGDHRGNFIDGLAGNDVICGNGGPDEIKGGEGNDGLLGGQGDDTLNVGDPFANADHQSAIGGGGDDHLVDPSLNANVSKDYFIGGAGDDTIEAGKGEDEVQGGPDNDHIVTEDGVNDIVDGGPGYDICDVDNLDVVSNCEEQL